MLNKQNKGLSGINFVVILGEYAIVLDLGVVWFKTWNEKEIDTEEEDNGSKNDHIYLFFGSSQWIEMNGKPLPPSNDFCYLGEG